MGVNSSAIFSFTIYHLLILYACIQFCAAKLQKKSDMCKYMNKNIRILFSADGLEKDGADEGIEGAVGAANIYQGVMHRIIFYLCVHVAPPKFYICIILICICKI